MASTEVLDNIELRKIERLYRMGKLCGKIKQKIIVQKNVQKFLWYKNEQKFFLRTYLYIAATDPLIVGFYPGEALLDRSISQISF